MVSWKSLVFICTDTKRRHCARFKLRRPWKKKKKSGSGSLFLFPLNINTTVDSIMRDHSMEADIQRRSESRTDGSAASCSRAEKRPLNNNILINAPLPNSVASVSNRRSHYWKLERRETEQGPSWLRPIGAPFTACFRSVSVGGVWLCEHWEPVDLLPLWKQQRLEGPWQEMTIKGVTSHQSL